MNDTMQEHEEHEGYDFSPIVGFAIGALVGGVVALLMAPDSGERTRRRIRITGRRVTRTARRTFEDARDTVSDAASDLGEDVKSALHAGREAFLHDGESQRGASVSRISRKSAPPTGNAS